MRRTGSQCRNLRFLRIPAGRPLRIPALQTGPWSQVAMAAPFGLPGGCGRALLSTGAATVYRFSRETGVARRTFRNSGLQAAHQRHTAPWIRPGRFRVVPGKACVWRKRCGSRWLGSAYFARTAKAAALTSYTPVHRDQLLRITSGQPVSPNIRPSWAPLIRPEGGGRSPQRLSRRPSQRRRNDAIRNDIQRYQSGPKAHCEDDLKER